MNNNTLDLTTLGQGICLTLNDNRSPSFVMTLDREWLYKFWWEMYAHGPFGGREDFMCVLEGYLKRDE